MSGARPFTDFIREHRNGLTLDELSDALQALVAAVVEEEKGGSLDLKVSIKPLGKRGEIYFEVACDIKSSPPKKVPGVSILFPTPENNLVRDDPKQSKMDLREVHPANAFRGVS